VSAGFDYRLPPDFCFWSSLLRGRLAFRRKLRGILWMD
jgi:hypothetical protein